MFIRLIFVKNQTPGILTSDNNDPTPTDLLSLAEYILSKEALWNHISIKNGYLYFTPH